MNMYVDSFDDDELEVVLDDSEGIEVVLDSTAITWSEINGDITKNKSVVEFLNNLPMLPDIPVEGQHRLKAVEGEALWEEDNLATRDELSLAKEELQADIDTKQDKGDYALKSELPDVTPYATNEALTTAKEELQADIDTKQDKGNYALKSEIPSITHLATKTEVESADRALTEAITKLDADKQAKGDYAVKSELTPLATKVELNNTSQALQNNIDGKQDKGDYALKSQIPDVSGYATKTQLTEGLNNKQDKGDYITKTLYDQTNEAFQNALNGKQATGDYVTKTDYATDSVAGVIKVRNVFGCQVADGAIVPSEIPLSTYLTKGSNLWVGKGTLENIKDDYVKRGITENATVLTEDEQAKAHTWLNVASKTDTDKLATKEELTSGLAGKQETGDYALKSEIPSLADYVKNTDYATASKGGVVKQSSTYGSGIANGFLYAAPKTLEGYTSASDNIFIGKGTLENIKDDYVKRGLTDNQVELTEEELAKIKAYLKFADNTDILTAIASIPQFKFSIVSNLPETGEKMTLYLVPKTGADNDVHNEYVWIEEESKYEYIGTTAVDLTDYVKKTDYATSTKAGLVRPNVGYGMYMSGEYPYAATKSLADYNSASAGLFVGKATLDNVLTQYAKTVSLTQAEYDALETKDANTLYLIEEE